MAKRRSEPARGAARVDRKPAGDRSRVAAGHVDASMSRLRRLALESATASSPLSLGQARLVVCAQNTAVSRAQRESHRMLVRLGQERRQLESQRRAELERRRRAYDESYALLASRGIRLSPGLSLRPEVTAIRDPLRILAEGDSWFSYPVPGSGGGIVPRLSKRLGVPIHSLAHAGDELRFMLGVDQRRELARELTRKRNAGAPYDVLLFSGGGNDVVDDPMCLWVRQWDVALSPAQHVHESRFNSILAVVRAGYEDLVALRDAVSPETRILVHAYDFAIPDGRDVCTYGPWLQPTFLERGFPTVGQVLILLDIEEGDLASDERTAGAVRLACSSSSSARIASS